MDHFVILWTLWRRVRETGVSIIIANEKGRLSRVEIDRMAQRQSNSALETSPQECNHYEP